MDIALDAMGGDHAPGPIVAGALKALDADPELKVTPIWAGAFQNGLRFSTALR